jgi:hypothetical protein
VPLAGSILLVATPSLLVISNWGMETSLAAALVLWALLTYHREHWLQLALALGLAIWARPDTIVLCIAIGLDYFYLRKTATSKPGLKPVLLFLSIALAFVGFNLLLSGTVLPNTFYAKLAYYSGGGGNFWSQLWNLLSGGGKIITFALAVIGIGWCASQKRRGNAALILYPLGMIILYRWKLPYLYQDGRYLIPILPFVLLLTIVGAERSAAWVGKSISAASVLAVILILITAIGQFSGMNGAVQALTSEDVYIHNLQVATAQWCAKSLPPRAVITTHDIGALGYYSGRRVVDLVGLADPAMIQFLKPGATAGAVRELRKQGVNYAALLDNWYEIANENTVFIDAPPGSETMRVYHFTDSSRFTGAKVLAIHKYLYDLLQGGDPRDFGEAMREAIAYEPDNALTYTLGGEVMLAMNRRDAAREYFEKALYFFPESERAGRDLSLCNGGK